MLKGKRKFAFGFLLHALEIESTNSKTTRASLSSKIRIQ
jgi:hypothetical protein